jgi:hypothetical protein
MVHIKWLGHASFLITGEGMRIITDPYKPSITNLEPVDDHAEVVVRSSNDDEAHCYIEHIPAGYTLLTATDYVEPGKSPQNVDGVDFHFMPSRESLIHKEIARENAFYRFSLEGITLAHLGDAGNALNDSQIEFLEDTDVLFALAGGPPTIELDELKQVIDHIRPRVVIPMHFRTPGPEFFMLPVEELLAYFPDDSVERPGTSELELDRPELPDHTRVIVLEPGKHVQKS